MADALISVTVERTAAIIEGHIRHEVKLLRGVEDGVQDLSGKLGSIRAVLHDADKRAVKEQSVKLWLKKLEDAAYEVEDILDEWHYALVNHKMEQPAAKQKEKVCCSFIPSPSSCLCFKKVAVRHAVGIKIQDMKLKLDQILIEKDQFKFVTSLPRSDVEPTPLRVQSTSSIELAKVQGSDIHNNKNKIVTKLMMHNSGTELLLLSIVGMGGLGKTTLAQLVYNDTRVKDCFELRIWICVSDPFDVAGIAKGIVDSVGRQSIPQGSNQLELALEKLRDSISGKKFLLVLDDVWTENYQEWEPLKINLGHGATGSKILVTSRNMRVAKMMGSSDDQVYFPQPLKVEECWSLLRSIALPRKSEEECREFEGVGMKIASKCTGLPLAANVLGSLLQFKDVKLEAWKNVLESEIWQLEKAEVDLFPHLLLSYNELSPALKRCFSYCAIYPKDSRIKAERLIEEWMALGYLGSIKGNGGVEVKGRDYFNNLAMRSMFQDITKNRDDGSIVECKMHDIVHDFAMFLRKNDASTAMTKSSCQVCSPLLVSQVQEYHNLIWGKESPMNVCDCLASVRVLTFEWKSLSLNGLPQGMKKLIHLRWLELSGKDLSEEDLKIICRLYFLQTLLLSDCSLENIPILNIPREIGYLVELRHLDISGNGELKELPSEIGNLVELRRLNLHSSYKLKELPECVCSLVELRILNLNRCINLQVLPEGIHRLRKLQRLIIAYTPASYHLPRGVGELSGLHSLETTFDEVSGMRTLETNFYRGSGGNKLGLLKKLNSLTGSLKLEIKIPSSTSDFEELVKDAEEADLRSKIHIHTLRIIFEKDEVEGSLSLSSSLWMDLMEALEPNQQKLNELVVIQGYMGSRLPQWISSPLSLVKEISLFVCNKLSQLPPFGRLPCLELLIIGLMKELKYVGRELLGIEFPSPPSSSTTTTNSKGVVAFPKLKDLHISHCPVWSEWEDITAEEEESAAVSVMPCLQELHIERCCSLKKLPHRLLRKASSSLRILDINGSSLLESQYGDKEGSEWRSISQFNPHLQLLLY